MRREAKQLLKGVVHRALKRPALEELLVEAYRRSPRALRPYLKKLAPHPRSYQGDEARQVDRLGLRWVFYPAAYFQWHHYYGFDDPVLALLRTLAARSALIVDVGANVGMYSLLMAAAAPPGAVVHAFEPSPDTHRHLALHCSMNAGAPVRCHPMALGAEPGVAQLFGAAGGDAGKASLHGHGGEGAEVQVEVSTLDAFAAREGLARVDLVKIDVEGFEPEVLLGARGVLERDRPSLVIELSPAWYADRAERARGAFSQLLALGYQFLEIAVPESPPPLLTGCDVLAALRDRKQKNVLALPAGRDPGELEQALQRYR